MSGRGHAQDAGQLAPVRQLAVVDAVAARTLNVADVGDRGLITPPYRPIPLMGDRPPMRVWQKKGDHA
ncbi:MAG: hypothetical protein ACREA0_11230 [bacterium]